MTKSKEYPTLQYLQNKILVPVDIEEQVDDEGNTSYSYTLMKYDDTNDNRQRVNSETAFLDYLNQLKRDKLSAGFEVDGVLFDSDNTAELRYLQLATKFSDDPDYSVQWKASNNVWVTMDKALFDQVMVAFETHISDVYTWLKSEQESIIS